jgi:enolase
VAIVNDVIGPALRGLDALDQIALDTRLLVLDGTDTKRRLGGNAMLGVSMAGARAGAASAHVPLYRHLIPPGADSLPVPLFDVINGGAHADNDLQVEELMIAPIRAPSFAEALRWGSECFAALRALLRDKGYRTSLGDEGGFAPDVGDDEEALRLVLTAVEQAGFEPGKDVVLALDAAASSLYDGAVYTFANRPPLSSAELVELWSAWVRAYPIWCLEDGMAENDFEGWKLLTQRLGREVTLVGDDVFATDPDVVSDAVVEEIGNALLVKLDQIGTITEAIEAIEEARAGRYAVIVSGRSGETIDPFIADFAVATGAGAIKSGAPSRGERVAKYNQLLRIEEQLGDGARYAGPRGLRA